MPAKGAPQYQIDPPHNRMLAALRRRKQERYDDVSSWEG
jgi:hypothetical protein